MAHFVLGEPERLLCPVLAVQRYKKRTDDPAFPKEVGKPTAYQPRIFH